VHELRVLKRSLTRDFRLQVFVMDQSSLGPSTGIPLGPFRIFTKIRRDIRYFVFTGVNDTGDKLYTSLNDTGDKSFAVLLTPTITLCSGQNMEKLSVSNCLSFIAGVIDTDN
jgi:hypothetical protein